MIVQAGLISFGGNIPVTSGIFSINGEAGPAITITSPSGTMVIGASSNTISIDTIFSGVVSLNSEFGPDVTLAGANGVDISVPSLNNILVDGAAASGLVVDARRYALLVG